MINEEISGSLMKNKSEYLRTSKELLNTAMATVRILLKGSNLTMSAISSTLNKMNLFDKSNEVSLEELAKDGSSRKVVKIRDKNIKQFKQELKKYGIKFSTIKAEKGKDSNYELWFQAKNEDIIENTLNKVSSQYDRSKEKSNSLEKPSVRKAIEEYKAASKEEANISKVKFKQQDISR